MCPVGQSGGHDDPRQFDEFVPGITAVFDTVLQGLEGPIGQPVVAHELPGILHRVEFRRSGRQGQERGVVGNVELFRGVQAGLIEHDNGVGAGCHLDCMAWVLQRGSTRAALAPRAGQMAPIM